jgi:alpha-ketoglutarate-dependent 2,4-dichlorophenoxyacetate dioxygenase
MLAIRPASPLERPDFFGVVTGIDLRETPGAATVAAIEAGMDRFGVLHFPEQGIMDEQQLAFGRCFGELELATGDIAQGAERRLAEPHLNDISNLGKSGEVLARDDRRRLFGLGNMLWHSDSSFKATPAKYSILSAQVLTSRGGNTEFADMRAAWDTLDAATQAEIRDLVAEHSQLYSRGSLGFEDWTEAERARWQPVPQRLVRRHPVTGRLSLFLASHAGAIRGMPVPEARMLLRDLTEHATQRERVHVHRWSLHDIVMWDNRVTMHRARAYPANEVRELRRTTVADIAPTLAQAA